jgi:hypothetical protein
MKLQIEEVMDALSLTRERVRVWVCAPLPDLSRLALRIRPQPPARSYFGSLDECGRRDRRRG